MFYEEIIVRIFMPAKIDRLIDMKEHFFKNSNLCALFCQRKLFSVVFSTLAQLATDK